MKKIATFWGSLDSKSKLFLIIVLLIVVWLLRNKIKGFVQATGKTVQNQSEISKLKSAGIKQTYSDEKYKKLADYLQRSMDGAGTETDNVFNAFEQLRNQVDYLKLEISFGVRSAKDNLFGMIEDADLTGWIKGDLSESEIKNLNSLLKLRGISKKF